MTGRRDGTGAGTDRPGDAALPTVRELLQLPEMVAGLPEVLSGGTGLDGQVRWAHMSDSPGVARLLNGGELLLSTGSAWPEDPDTLRRFIVELTEAGIAGLVLELGVHYRWAPAVVVETARAHDLVLVVLHREVKFVTISEVIHRGIIDRQTGALRARDEVREHFTTLALRGSPADYIVEQLALTIGAPVVLENLAHEVVTAQVPPAMEEELFTTWPALSRRAHQTAARATREARGSDIRPGTGRGSPATVTAAGTSAGTSRAAGTSLATGAAAARPNTTGSAVPDSSTTASQGHTADVDPYEHTTGTDWLVVPVEARGTRWGHLVALPGPEHPAGRLGVLQQGAIALALGRLADSSGEEWERNGRRRLLDRLLSGRFASLRGASARLTAAGIPIQGRQLYGMVISRVKVTPDRADIAARTLRGRAVVGSAPDSVPQPAATLLVSLPHGQSFDDATALTLAEAASSGSIDRAVVAVGSAAQDLDAALISLQEAIDLARGRMSGKRGEPRLRRADSRPLMRLVSTLRDDRRLIEHGERMLAPLIEHDLAKQGDLLDVLAATLAHPANRTAAAAAAHLSRSVFYQRLALIEELLSVDLDDGETQTALHLALLARRGSRW